MEFVTGKIVKADDSKQIMFGWASVAEDENGLLVVDAEHDFIDDPDMLEDSAYLYVSKSRAATDTHRRTGVGELVESFVITEDKREAMGIPVGVLPRTAWWVGIKIHDADLWKSVRDGEHVSFSIGGTGRRTLTTVEREAVYQ